MSVNLGYGRWLYACLFHTRFLGHSYDIEREELSGTALNSSDRNKY